MLHGFLVFLYVSVSLFLIAVVLLQTGKRADLAGAFGGGGSQTAFGSRGAASLLTKLTTASAVGFMVLALTLSLMARRGAQGSVLDEVQAPAPALEESQDPGAAPPGSEPATSGAIDETEPGSPVSSDDDPADPADPVDDAAAGDAEQP